jgi:hypothetical protein
LIASASLWMHATHPYVDVGGKNADAKKKKKLGLKKKIMFNKIQRS